MNKLQVCLSIILVVLSTQVWGLDWNSVEGRKMTLFYPGQASWEWALTQSSHSGAKNFRKGKNCRSCHSGEEQDIGSLIVSGEKLEPDPITGKPGSIQIEVKVAHDDDDFYLRLSWPVRPSTVETAQDSEFESRITMMIGDSNVKEATRAGCWGVCHSDLSRMPNDLADGESLKKYLSRSRTKVTRQGGGRNYKPQNELDEMGSAGYFLEYWQVGLSQGQTTAIAGYVLEKRVEFEDASLDVDAEIVDGYQIVTMRRSLQLNVPHRKDLLPGTIFAVGFALHEDYSSGRSHFVSLEHSLVLDEGEADFVVKSW